MLAVLVEGRAAHGQGGGAADRRAGLAAIVADIPVRYPWLKKLDGGAAIVSHFARRIELERRIGRYRDQLDKLPHLAGTIRTADKDRRRRARKPLERRLQRAVDALDALPNHTEIDPTEILADDFLKASSAEARAGRRAMVREMKQYRAVVALDTDVLQAPYAVRLLLGGSWLMMEKDGLHAGAFFRPTSAPAVMAVQAAFFAEVARHGRRALHAHVDRHPHLVGVFLDQMIAEQQEALLAREMAALAPRDPVITAIRDERRAVAGRLRRAAITATLPLAMVLRVFAIEDATDLFLTLFPASAVVAVVGKVRKARKARKLARLSRKERKLFKRVIEKADVDQKQAIWLLHRLKHQSKQLAAAAKILERTGKDATLLKRLLVRRIQRTADLAWIEQMMVRRKFDGDFVKNFTQYDSNPSWQALRGVIENNIGRKARASLVSKLVGFVGEDAAARWAAGAGFARTCRLGKGQRLAITRGEEALDLVGRTPGKETKLVIAEVKNWSSTTWQSASKRAEIVAQLGRHREKIDKVLKGASRDWGDIRAKFLMVEESGYLGLDPRIRREFEARIGDWKVETIPTREVETVGEFIGRLQ